MENVMKRLLELAAEVLSRSVEFDQDREEVPEWDSLTHLIIITRVEEEFGIKIPIEETSNIRKLSDFLKYISTPCLK